MANKDNRRDLRGDSLDPINLNTGVRDKAQGSEQASDLDSLRASGAEGLARALTSRNPLDGLAFDGARKLSQSGYPPELILRDVIKLSAQSASEFRSSPDLLRNSAESSICGGVISSVPELRILAGPLISSQRSDAVRVKPGELDPRIVNQLEAVEREIGILLGSKLSISEGKFVRRCAEVIGAGFSDMPEEMKRGVILGNITFDDVSFLAPDTDAEVFRRVLNYTDWMSVEIEEERVKLNKIIENVSKSVAQQPQMSAVIMSNLFEGHEPKGHWNLARVIINGQTSHRDWGSKGAELFKSMQSFAKDGDLPQTFVDSASTRLLPDEASYQHLLDRLRGQVKPFEVMVLTTLLRDVASRLERNSGQD